MTLRQLIEILHDDECLEFGTADGRVNLCHYGGEAIAAVVKPYLDWTCSGLGIASLDSVGVTIDPPETGKDGKKAGDDLVCQNCGNCWPTDVGETCPVCKASLTERPKMQEKEKSDDD